MSFNRKVGELETELRELQAPTKHIGLERHRLSTHEEATGENG